MHDLALMAAAEWARANTPCNTDPVNFGHKVALVYCACRATQHHSGDEKATTAALAALSVRPEVLQAIALLASLNSVSPVDATRTNSAGAES